MFVRYSDSVETLQAGEAETVDQITATLLSIAKKVGERQRHTVRGVHAKSHGLSDVAQRVEIQSASVTRFLGKSTGIRASDH
jgi:hypothetical protein